jgi:dolichol kinase
MYVSLTFDLYDWLYAVILFIFIITIIYLVKRFENVWVNRKIVHLSSVPAVIFYMYFFKTLHPFLFFSILFTILLTLKHARGDLSRWFQVDGNYGEIFFTFSYTLISLLFWGINRVLGGLIMLFLAIGDSITGIVRSRFVTKWQKHWTGSIAMLIACVALGYLLYGFPGIILGVIATVAECQPYLDDNLSIPLSTALASLITIIIV